MEDVAMRTMDLAPLWRNSIGFDRFFNLVEDSAHWSTEDNYPPYNIEKTGEDQYAISLAVAGFAPEDMTITAEQNTLTVEGRKTVNKTVKEAHAMLYQGISSRSFRRTFSLADHVQVQGATFENGLLKVELVREIPEAMKARRIAISQSSSNENTQIGQKKAA
jgi:molecular chaperone IbpA